jgi:hypothetical protein
VNAIAWLCCFVGFSCASSDQEFSGALPAPDGRLFVEEAYPLLLRDCAFVTCHGAQNRFFQVYGPGRVRFDVTATEPSDPATLAEVLHSYDRARSMLTTSDTREKTLLLRKPLELQAGGQGHQGVDALGRNVFASASDPGYQVLLRWANSEGLPPTAAQVAAANAAAVDVPPQEAP